jgi:hypothetical protein
MTTSPVMVTVMPWGMENPVYVWVPPEIVVSVVGAKGP